MNQEQKSKYISSSEIEAIDGVEYLSLFLAPRFLFKIKINNEESETNQIYLKAPTLSSADINDVRKCSIVISKFQSQKDIEIQKQLRSMSEEEVAKTLKILDEYQKDKETKKNEAESTEDIKKECKLYISETLRTSKSYQVEKDDFYTEFDKLTHFLQKRVFYMSEGSVKPFSFDEFNYLLAEKQFLLEAVFAEYVGFFSKHFPLESLSSLGK